MNNNNKKKSKRQTENIKKSTYHDMCAENPEYVIEKQTSQKNCTNFVTPNRNSLNGLYAKRYAQYVIHQEMLVVEVEVCENTGEERAHDFCGTQEAVNDANIREFFFETILSFTCDEDSEQAGE